MPTVNRDSVDPAFAEAEAQAALEREAARAVAEQKAAEEAANTAAAADEEAASIEAEREAARAIAEQKAAEEAANSAAAASAAEEPAGTSTQGEAPPLEEPFRPARSWSSTGSEHAATAATAGVGAGADTAVESRDRRTAEDDAEERGLTGRETDGGHPGEDHANGNAADAFAVDEVGRGEGSHDRQADDHGRQGEDRGDDDGDE